MKTFCVLLPLLIACIAVDGVQAYDCGDFICNTRCPGGLYKWDDFGCLTCECLCPDISSCQLFCEHGHLVDNEQCPICECIPCPSMDTCEKICPDGLQIDDNGCELCECRGPPACEELDTTEWYRDQDVAREPCPQPCGIFHKRLETFRTLAGRRKECLSDCYKPCDSGDVYDCDAISALISVPSCSRLFVTPSAQRCGCSDSYEKWDCRVFDGSNLVSGIEHVCKRCVCCRPCPAGNGPPGSGKLCADCPFWDALDFKFHCRQEPEIS